MSELCWVELSTYWVIMRLKDVLFCHVKALKPEYCEDKLKSVLLEVVVLTDNYNVDCEIKNTLSEQADNHKVEIIARIEVQLINNTSDRSLRIGPKRLGL